MSSGGALCNYEKDGWPEIPKVTSSKHDYLERTMIACPYQDFPFTCMVSHVVILNSCILSLYSTATQNHPRWVVLRHLTQKIVLLRYLTQKIPTC